MADAAGVALPLLAAGGFWASAGCGHNAAKSANPAALCRAKTHARRSGFVRNDAGHVKSNGFDLTRWFYRVSSISETDD